MQKVCLVTGGSGISAAVCQALKRGCRVYALSRSGTGGWVITLWG